MYNFLDLTAGVVGALSYINFGQFGVCGMIYVSMQQCFMFLKSFIGSSFCIGYGILLVVQRLFILTIHFGKVGLSTSLIVCFIHYKKIAIYQQTLLVTVKNSVGINNI